MTCKMKWIGKIFQVIGIEFQSNGPPSIQELFHILPGFGFGRGFMNAELKTEL